jgi:hypothetical protein
VGRWSTHPGSQIGYHRTIRGPGGCRPARFRFNRLKSPGCRARRTARRDDPTGASAGGFVLGLRFLRKQLAGRCLLENLLNHRLENLLNHRLENLLNHRLENLLNHRLENLLNLFGCDNQAVTFCLAPDPVSLGLHHARRVALHSDS